MQHQLLACTQAKARGWLLGWQGHLEWKLLLLMLLLLLLGRRWWRLQAPQAGSAAHMTGKTGYVGKEGIAHPGIKDMWRQEQDLCSAPCASAQHTCGLQISP
jgi:hypothetical protein